MVNEEGWNRCNKIINWCFSVLALPGCFGDSIFHSFYYLIIIICYLIISISLCIITLFTLGCHAASIGPLIDLSILFINTLIN